MSKMIMMLMMMLMRMNLWFCVCANHPSHAPPLFRERVGGFSYSNFKLIRSILTVALLAQAEEWPSLPSVAMAGQPCTCRPGELRRRMPSLVPSFLISHLLFAGLLVCSLPVFLTNYGTVGTIVDGVMLDARGQEARLHNGLRPSSVMVSVHRTQGTRLHYQAHFECAMRFLVF